MKWTQIEAWEATKLKLGQKQYRVWKFLMSLKDGGTACELMDAMNLPTNAVAPRLTELEYKGLVYINGARRNPQTGYWMNVYFARPEPELTLFSPHGKSSTPVISINDSGVITFKGSAKVLDKLSRGKKISVTLFKE